MAEEIHSLQNGNNLHITVPAKMQVLYTDENGALQGCMISAQGQWEIPCAADNDVRIRQRFVQVQSNQTADGIGVEAVCLMDAEVYAEQGSTVITGVQLGETVEPDPNRPSLILRSCGEEQLWDIAKKCGTTVEAIRTANQLTQEPEKGQMLLIPVP
jgi:hypothetical protein